MRKSRSSSDLFLVRIRQLGRQLGHPEVREGFSYNKQGDAVPDIGDNRRTRRMFKAMLGKGKALTIKPGSNGDNQ